jgi:uncharacterized protein (TIGR00255 family)
MPYSMTGFGTGSSEASGTGISWEIRSVNHRYFDFHAHLPRAFFGLETELEARAREVVARGRVDATLVMKGAAAQPGQPVPNLPRAQALLAAYRQLALDLGLPLNLDVGMVAAWPGVIETSQAENEASEPLREAVMSSFEHALGALTRARLDEGERLACCIEEHVTALGVIRQAIARRLPELKTERRQRLVERWHELCLGIDASEQRVTEALVLAADRMDITEELERLEAHERALLETLRSGGAVGRRLDFLSQEMGREANTLGSKSLFAEMTLLAVDMKAEIERIREQVQNVQ